MRNVVSFDSTGTLLHVSKSVGYHYTRVLNSFFPGSLTAQDSIQVAKEFDKNFALHYRAAVAAHAHFGAGSIGAYSWWSGVVRETFISSNVCIKNYQFPYVFDEIYQDFGTTKCWNAYPDTMPILKKLHSAGVDVVVVSDFDERLPKLLHAHGLYLPDEPSVSLIQDVITSYSVGISKPELLALAKEKWNISLHVGDSLKRDVAGAQAAGILPVYLERTCSGEKSTKGNTIHTLKEVLKLID